MLGSASLMSRSSRPFRSSSPKSFALVDPVRQPAVFLQRLRREQTEVEAVFSF